MRNDKFILICMVCLIVFCRIWGMFPITTIDTADTAKITLVEEQNVSDNNAVVEPTKNFVGCSASFSSQNTARSVNGEISGQYSGKNIITCDCIIDGEKVKRIAIYRYSSEPKQVELDCNSKCSYVCVKK